MSCYVFDDTFQRVFLDGIMIRYSDMMLAVLHSCCPDVATYLSGFMISIVLF